MQLLVTVKNKANHWSVVPETTTVFAAAAMMDMGGMHVVL